METTPKGISAPGGTNGLTCPRLGVRRGVRGVSNPKMVYELKKT